VPTASDELGLTLTETVVGVAQTPHPVVVEAASQLPPELVVTDVMLKEKPFPTAAMVGFWGSGFAPPNDWVNASAATGWKTCALRGLENKAPENKAPENKAMEARTAASGKRAQNGLGACMRIRSPPVELVPQLTRLARKDPVVNILSLSNSLAFAVGRNFLWNRVPGCPHACGVTPDAVDDSGMLHKRTG